MAFLVTGVLHADYPEMDLPYGELALDTPKSILAEKEGTATTSSGTIYEIQYKTSTILSIIGKGVNRITEIASESGERSNSDIRSLWKVNYEN